MRATVQLLNQKTGRFAISTPSGLTVVEVVDSIELEVGDEIIGDFDEHGSVTLRHEASGVSFDAFVQAIGAGEPNARELLA